MQDTDFYLLDPDTAETVMRAKDEILTIADGILAQAGDLADAPSLLGTMREHRAAVGMAAEIMLAHESDNPADELLYVYAESIMLWHLRALAWLCETPLPH